MRTTVRLGKCFVLVLMVFTKLLFAESTLYSADFGVTRQTSDFNFPMPNSGGGNFQTMGYYAIDQSYTTAFASEFTVAILNKITVPGSFALESKVMWDTDTQGLTPIQWLGGEELFGQGFLIFNYQSPSNFMYASATRIGATDGKPVCTIGKSNGLTQTPIASLADCVAVTSQLYDMAIQVEGANVMLSINGNKKISTTLSAPVSGGVGLGMQYYANGHALFSNFSVSLPALSGYVDQIMNGQIYGWAYDPANSTQSVGISIYADAAKTSLVGETIANIPRDGVNQVFGVTGNHGFAFSIPSQYLTAGTNLYVFESNASSDYSLPVLNGSPVAVPAPPPTGWVDGIYYGMQMEGWVYDPAAPSQSLNMKVYADAAQTQLVGSMVANVPRPGIDQYFNITGNHEFLFNIPSQYMKPGQKLYVFEQNAAGTAWNQVNNSPMTVVAAPPTGWTDGIFSKQIQGWALDPMNSSQSVTINIYADAALTQLVGTTSANITRPGIDALFNITGNHAFSFPIPANYQKVGQTFYVVSLNASGAAPTLLGGSPVTYTGQ